MATLTDLPHDLLAAIVPWLDIGSAVSLARTARALSDLAKNHPHWPLLSAVRSTELPAYRKAVTLLHARGAATLSDHDHDHDHSQRLCFAVLVCAYVLVDHGCTDPAWWAPLSVLVATLAPNPNPQPARLASKSALGRLFVRTLKLGAMLGRTRVLDCFRELQGASDWLVFRRDWTLLPALMQGIIVTNQPAWSRQHRLDVLLSLARVAKDVSVVGFAQSEHGLNESLMETLVSTNDVLLIVSMVVTMNDHRADEWRIDTMYLATYATTHPRYSSLFDLFSTSYITALHDLHQQHTMPPPPLLLNTSFPSSPSAFETLAQLRQQFAFQGITSSLTAKFLDHLKRTCLESEFLPWLFGCAGDAEPKWQHTTVELTWLFSHVHPHVAMLHTLPFNSELGADDKASHGSGSLNLVLHHVPVDLNGQSTHLAHALRPFGTSYLDPDHCPRCAHLLERARLLAPSDPLLEKFASAKWHVSCDAIPRDQWLAEARAISRLLAASAGPAHLPSASDWMDYVDSLAPIVRAPPRHGDADKVDWRSVRETGINKMDLAAVVYAYVCEDRFEDAHDLIRERDGLVLAGKDRLRVRDGIASSLDRIRGNAAQLTHVQRAQICASLVALMNALSTGE
ncbi:hypothetical protein BCR44DRAFT_47950 [Catenaria anguillulae PL171]|uniref:F-box domain-containing protein n=1 Tax=Catenaria anguillulae PL171 TaxID=765915 RepID=A0A1Y2HJ71_9FUNG|nr:hypothetical protein BCR44DRAFT_47950 [Catenaria anguillulae PL171]